MTMHEDESIICHIYIYIALDYFYDAFMVLYCPFRVLQPLATAFYCIQNVYDDRTLIFV